jgi:hypothetical protein
VASPDKEAHKKRTLAISVGLSVTLHLLVFLISGPNPDSVSSLPIVAVGEMFLLAIGFQGSGHSMEP